MFSGTSQATISLNVNDIRLSLSIVMPESLVSTKSFEIPCLYLYLASPVKIANDRRAIYAFKTIQKSRQLVIFNDLT